MKLYIKIISLILCAATLVGIFSGCGGVSENSEYITKGEFFALFIEENNMYSKVYSAEEIAANETYELEAKVMREWELIDDEQAKSLDNAVTKEIVAQSCVRFMSFRQTCSADIKDIRKCHDQQAIIDAVGMGIFDLNNGYFDALEKMSYEDCREAIKRMDTVVRETRFNKQLEIVYQEGVETLDPEVVLDIEYVDADENENNALVAENMSIKPSESKAIALDDGNGNELKFSTMATKKDQVLWVTISSEEYRRYPTKYANGVIIKYNPLLPDNKFVYKDASRNTPFAGKIIKVLHKYGQVTLVLAECEFKEVINTQCKEINDELTTYDFVFLNDFDTKDKLKDVNIKTTENKKGLIVSFDHTFSLEDKIYKKQTWRNASAKPKVGIVATLENFMLTTKNLGLMLEGCAEEGDITFEYDTTVKVTAESGGLRYSPPNNGNSKFLSALKNSRWTGVNAGGSKDIKITDFVASFEGIITVIGTLYLVIQMDGSISITVKQKQAFNCSLKKYGVSGVKNISSDPYLDEVNIKANITTGLRVDVDINFLCFNIFGAEGKILADLDVQANIYRKDNEKEPAAKNVYVAMDEIAEHRELCYCTNIEVSITLSATVPKEDSIIGKIMRKVLDKDAFKPSKTWPLKSHHYEDGIELSACSRYNSAVVEVNSDGEIRVSSYKENLQVDGTASVAITSLPLTDNKINNNGGIKIKTGNKKVATAKLNEETKTVQITAVGEGSTEITLQIKKNNSKKYYTQKISVTVYGNEMSFSPYDSNQFWNSKEAVKFC
ncbi:MAG: hypothetical protein IKK09_08120 [Clostridia bacterium]|nr:hypothetical protein [Clostridia bacterium]